MRTRMTVVKASMVSVLLLVLVVEVSTLLFAAKTNFISFDFPSAIDTEATAITPSGAIAGRYTSPDGMLHGFVFEAR